MTGHSKNYNFPLFDPTADLSEKFLDFIKEIAGTDSTSSFNVIDSAMQEFKPKTKTITIPANSNSYTFDFGFAPGDNDLITIAPSGGSETAYVNGQVSASLSGSTLIFTILIAQSSDINVSVVYQKAEAL